jgi:hypothetical protein
VRLAREEGWQGLFLEGHGQIHRSISLLSRCAGHPHGPQPCNVSEH